MPYMTNIQRLAAKEARKETREEVKEAREDITTLQKKIKEARQEAADLLAEFLTMRFGAVPAAATERINKASFDQMKIWTERTVSAATLDEVFRKATH